MASEESRRVFFSSRNAASSSGFDLAIRELRAAGIQVDRIWKHPIASGDPQIVAGVFQDILIDVHFYFISLRNLYRFLHLVVSDPEFEHLQPELEKLNSKWFEHYSKGREAFEHIDQRLPGRKHEGKIEQVEEGGAKRNIHYGLRLRDGLFVHSDLKWDITRQTFGELRRDVEALVEKIVDNCEASDKCLYPSSDERQDGPTGLVS